MNAPLKVPMPEGKPQGGTWHLPSFIGLFVGTGKQRVKNQSYIYIVNWRILGVPPSHLLHTLGQWYLFFCVRSIYLLHHYQHNLDNFSWKCNDNQSSDSVFCWEKKLKSPIIGKHENISCWWHPKLDDRSLIYMW